MAVSSPPPQRVPPPPPRFKPSGRGEMNASAIIDALREAENPPPPRFRPSPNVLKIAQAMADVIDESYCMQEHNRREAEREVEMLLRGEGHLYRYAPFATQ